MGRCTMKAWIVGTFRSLQHSPSSENSLEWPKVAMLKVLPAYLVMESQVSLFSFAWFNLVSEVE